jgi:hypothetical protein
MRKREGKANQTMLPVMRPEAAGIDIGATEILVAVPRDRVLIISELVFFPVVALQPPLKQFARRLTN